MSFVKFTVARTIISYFSISSISMEVPLSSIEVFNQFYWIQSISVGLRNREESYRTWEKGKTRRVTGRKKEKRKKENEEWDQESDGEKNKIRCTSITLEKHKRKLQIEKKCLMETHQFWDNCPISQKSFFSNEVVFRLEKAYFAKLPETLLPLLHVTWNVYQ